MIRKILCFFNEHELIPLNCDADCTYWLHDEKCKHCGVIRFAGCTTYYKVPGFSFGTAHGVRRWLEITKNRGKKKSEAE